MARRPSRTGSRAVASRRAAGFFRPTQRSEVVWVEGENELAVGIAGYAALASAPDAPVEAAWKAVRLIGGTALPPRWTLGFANTAMALADFPDAQHKIREFLALAERDQFPLSSFHFGSGYTSRGKQRYVFTWNTSKFPDARGLLAAFKSAGVRTMANLKPCLLDDHPRLAEVEAAGALVMDGDSGAPAVAQFWDGLGFHLDFTNPATRTWWKAQVTAQLLEVGIAATWNDNNEFEVVSPQAQAAMNGQPRAAIETKPLQTLLILQILQAKQLFQAVIQMQKLPQ